MLDAIVAWEDRRRAEHTASLRRKLEQVLRDHGVPSSDSLVNDLEEAAAVFGGALVAARVQAWAKQKRYENGETLNL